MADAQSPLVSDVKGSLRGLFGDVVAVVAFPVGYLATLLAGVLLSIAGAVLAGIYWFLARSGNLGLPSPSTMGEVGAVILAIVIFFGPAIWMGLVFVAGSGRRVARPGVALLVPVPVVLGVLAYLATAGVTVPALVALVAAQIVLANRVFGGYARNVRTLALPWWGRAFLGALALAPAAAVGTVEEFRFITGQMDSGSGEFATLYAELNRALLDLGAPGPVGFGSATLTPIEFLLVVTPLVVCGGYLLVQGVASAPARSSGVEPGRPPDVDDAVETAEEHLTAARNHRADGDREAALDEYDDAREAFETAAETAAEADYGRGRYDRRAAEAESAAAQTVREAVVDAVDRTDEHLERAVSAAEAGEYDEAVDAYDAAAEATEEGLETHQTLEPHSVVPEDAGEDAADGLRERRDRAASGGATVLVDRARAAAEEAAQFAEEGNLAASLDAYGDAEDDLEAARSRADEAGVDPPEDLDPLSGDLESAVEHVETERTRFEVRESFSAVEETLSTARARRDAGEYEAALEAYRSARDDCEDAAEAAREAGIEEQEPLEEHLEDVEAAIEETEREHALTRAQAAIDAGDELAVQADEVAEDGDYEEAESVYTEARERYDEAVSLLEGYDVAEIDEAARKRDGAESDREAAVLSGIAERITDAREVLEEGDPAGALETFEAVLDETDDLLEEAARTADVETLRERARAGALRARIAAGRETVETAEGRFEAGEYRAAEEAFESARETFAHVAEAAADEDLDLAEEREEAKRLAEVCADNAETAREAHYGVSEGTPELRSAEAVEEAEVPDDTVGIDRPEAPTDRAAPGAGTGTDPGGSLKSDTTDDPIDEEKLTNDPPAFERLEELGAGGSAEVTKVRLESGEVLALKEPRRIGTMGSAAMEEFAAEASTWEQLKHPHIVELIDWGVVPTPWMLLEYMEGGDLAARIGQIEVWNGVEIVGGLSEAVDRAHRLTGMAHTDIKPENVLFTEVEGEEVAKLADWGLARTMLGPDEAGGMTPEYAAPEQVDPDRFGGVGLHTDVYQLGVLAYEVFAGQHPYAGVESEDLSAAITDRDPDPPSTVNPQVPRGIDEAVATAMARDPQERFEAPLYLRDRLRDALEGSG